MNESNHDALERKLREQAYTAANSVLKTLLNYLCAPDMLPPGYGIHFVCMQGKSDLLLFDENGAIDLPRQTIADNMPPPTVLDDLLELSRIESRELKLELEVLDVAPVVDHVLSQHAHRATLRNIALVQDLAPASYAAEAMHAAHATSAAYLTSVTHATNATQTWRARADRRALEHILTNLVDNALKYCPPGSRVSIRAKNEGPLVRILVSDNGPGIAPQHLERVFERFYRVDAGRSRELGGTGLGLSIVKHLAEAMQGSVSVQSTPGAGTTFSFTLLQA